MKRRKQKKPQMGLREVLSLRTQQVHFAVEGGPSPEDIHTAKILEDAFAFASKTADDTMAFAWLATLVAGLFANTYAVIAGAEGTERALFWAETYQRSVDQILLEFRKQMDAKEAGGG